MFVLLSTLVTCTWFLFFPLGNATNADSCVSFLPYFSLPLSRWLGSPSAFTPFLCWIVCCIVVAELSFVCPRGMSRFIVCRSTAFFLMNNTKFFRSPPFFLLHKGSISCPVILRVSWFFLFLGRSMHPHWYLYPPVFFVLCKRRKFY